MKMMITLDINQADEEELRIYLDYLKNQMEKYTNINISDITVLKTKSEIDKEVTEQLNIAKQLDWNKKAPSAKGAISKLPPRL